MTRILCVMFAVLLAGCAPKPEFVRAEPPVVNCSYGSTQAVPPWPVLWYMDGPVFTIIVLSILTEERILRKAEQDCIATHKTLGVIR